MNAKNSDRQTGGQIMAKHRLRFRSKSASRATSPASSSLDLTNNRLKQPPDDRITLNVGGVRFQTRRETLSKMPGSVLHQLVESCKQTEDPDINYEYFFDRSAAMFESILSFYRLGELHFGHHLCPSEIRLELNFWKLPESCMADCCWLRYICYFEKEKERQNLQKIFGETKAKTVRVGEATAYVYEPTYIGSISALIKDCIRTLKHWLPSGLSRRLQILNVTLGSSRRDIQVFLLLLFVFAAIFSVLIRLVESSDNIPSMGSALWWAIVTMTTVGFGDVHPTSGLGYVIGVLCAIVGVILVATILPVLASRYIEYYGCYEGNVKIKTRRMLIERRSSNKDETHERQKDS